LALLPLLLLPDPLGSGRCDDEDEGLSLGSWLLGSSDGCRLG
jgi:hypothetical protein